MAWKVSVIESKCMFQRLRNEEIHQACREPFHHQQLDNELTWDSTQWSVSPIPSTESYRKQAMARTCYPRRAFNQKTTDGSLRYSSGSRTWPGHRWFVSQMSRHGSEHQQTEERCIMKNSPARSWCTFCWWLLLYKFIMIGNASQRFLPD